MKTSTLTVFREGVALDASGEIRGYTDDYSFFLAPSQIHGIGVYIRHSVGAGTELHLFHPEETTRYFPLSAGSDADEKGGGESLEMRFGVRVGDLISCPANFSRMSVGWYLNHSEAANAYHRDYVYFAACTIEAGQEITVDYNSVDDLQGAS